MREHVRLWDWCKLSETERVRCRVRVMSRFRSEEARQGCCDSNVVISLEG